MIEVMKGYFGNAISEHVLVTFKKAEEKEKSLLDSEMINQNQEEIKNLYVSLFKEKRKTKKFTQKEKNHLPIL